MKRSSLLPLLLAIGPLLVLASDPPALRELGAAHHLLVGTAVRADALEKDAAYRDTLRRHFAIVTPENEMKIKALRPTGPDKWNFGPADRIVAFAEKNGLLLRGHTLIWNANEHSPKWFLDQPATREVATRLMREHITTVMNHYRGHVRDWDVVNEAISNDNRATASPYNDGYWFRALGQDYIALAFRLARETDPHAGLFYNDYDHGLALGPKSDRIYELLRSLKAAGVPIDGVGLQLHCNIEKPPSRDALIKNFRRLAALGLRVQVTELDVEIMSSTGPLAQRLDRQAKVYGDVFAAALESGCVEAVLTWGFTDKFRQSALLARKKLPPQETPMWLFDANYQPKPAFNAVVSALQVNGPAR